MKPRPMMMAAFFLAAGFTLGAQTIKTAPKALSLNHDPDVRVVRTNSITIGNDRAYVGSYYIVFTATPISPTPSPDPLDYGLYAPPGSTTRRLSLNGNPSSAAEVLQGNFPTSKNDREILSFDEAVEKGSLPAPGTYNLSIRADLYLGSFPSAATPVDTTTFTLTIIVANRTAISVVDPGMAFDQASTARNLSFGVLGPSQACAADIIVRSNVAYTLSIVSANRGAIKHIDPLDASTVAYAFSVNRVLTSLQSGSASPISGASTGYRGALYALSFLIEGFNPLIDLPTEGDYTDALTLTLTAP